jgi:glycosyltransferase A (GT-A) superfamily protein (DUF2064 family)
MRPFPWVGWQTVQKALILFTKVPEPGRVKTRLLGGKGLSPTDACNLYSAILMDIFDIMRELTDSIGARLYVCYAPRNEEAKLRDLLCRGESTEVTFFPQNDEDATAERIALAFDRAFSEGINATVVIFGDQPQLDLDLLHEAFRILESAAESKKQQIVLGPTCDGGTYLIGSTSGLASWLRSSIDCSSSNKAVSKLVAKAQGAALQFTLLSERSDLDDLDDLTLLRIRPPENYLRTMALLRTLPSSPSHEMISTVSVIIPTLNEERTLERTIRSIRANPYPSEVIVVDGGSSDRTLDIANRFADRVIVTTERGRQSQENVGARGAKGGILLFLHADTTVPPTLLQSIAVSLKDPEIVAGGAHLAYSSPRRSRYIALCALRDIGSSAFGISGMGSSFFIRRETFRMLGGFDEHINEEAVDICKKLHGLGKHVILNEVVQTSARRYESSGFFRTLCAWAITVGLSYFGIHAVSIEKYLWRVVR